MKIKVLIVCLLMLSFIVAAYGNDDDSEIPDTITKISKPVVVSTSYFDIDKDGKDEIIEIIITKGESILVKQILSCEGGSRWRGDFSIRVRKGKKSLSSRSLNKIMGYQGGALSFWMPNFSLVFKDYNNDGQIDFNLGQQGSCEHNNYWLFTITRKGMIEPLLFDGHIDYFSILIPNGYNSTDKIILEEDKGLFRNSTYDLGDEIEYFTWYRWNGKQFIAAKKKQIAYRETFKEFSISREQLVGTWTSESGDNVQGSVVLKADGTFKATCRQRAIDICNVTGKWHVRDNHFIWIYDEDHGDFKKGQEDVNTVIDFETDQFLLREITGASTTFKRAK